VIDWTAERVAEAAGARLVRGAPGGPSRASVDSREISGGELFVGLPGSRAAGGEFAAEAIAAGAWGVLVARQYAPQGDRAAVLVADDPLASLQALARAWRRELGASVVAITGSTGKTSTKDIVAALLASELATFASPLNLNTEIGVPLAILGAPPATQALVLELAMRGPGQVAELAAIGEPDVGVIVNVGPAHLELLGTLEAIAAAKAELIAALAPGATVIVPADEPLLEPHLRPELRTVTFGEGGDVRLVAVDEEGIEIDADGERLKIEPGFRARHQVSNLLAAVAAARALGITPSGHVPVVFSSGRGDRIVLPGGLVVIDDCYNANPMSMRAALDDLAASATGRRVAVLGDMLELGPEAERYHRELGGAAAAAGVDVLVTVGPLAALAGESFGGVEHRHAEDARAAAALVTSLVRDDDTVLIKGSRGVGLEVVASELAGGARG
jgi:UDP-N-acetylmuramoyl-tripeptide--D-alanyl-D-alanine ligase